MRNVKLSLVVPFFNEEKIIKRSLFVLNSHMDRFYPRGYELIFVNDGSKDKSLQIVEKEIKKYPRSKLITYKQNKGRGYAVTRGFKAAHGEIIGFIDSDLEIDSKYINICVDEIGINDIAVVSKYAKGSVIKTTMLRKIASKVFNLWVGFVLDRDLADHQGGLKLAKAKVVKKILPKVRSHGWLFDLEFLYFAKKEGFRVAKVPVNISYGFRGVRASLGFDFLKSLVLVFKLRPNKWSLLVVPSFAVLALLAYKNFPGTFFQQDEWQFFGADIFALSSRNPVANVLLPFGGQVTHFYPLSNLALLMEYIFFKMSFAPYALVALGFHFLNTFLVYYFLSMITKNRLISFFSASLFLVNSISHQAVTWVLVSIANLPATALILLSLIFFYNFLQSKKGIFFIISLLSLVVSLLFKEISFFIFILFGICMLFLRLSRKYLLILAGSGFAYFIIRLFFLFSDTRSAQPEIGDVSATSPMIYAQRLLLVPLKGLAQSFFPQELLIRISGIWTTNETFAQTVVFDRVCYFISTIMFVIFTLFVLRLVRMKEFRLSKVIALSLFFLILSFLPFIFIPGKAGYFSIFEPRNLYVAGIASSFMITFFVYKLFPRTLFFFLMVCLIIININRINMDLTNQRNVGNVRKSLLLSIERDYSDLPDKVVIYTRSDRSYYGLPENEKILPIQSGFGRMLMVWYQDKEMFPGCLYENQFLHDLVSQGYRYCEDRGFGYFRDYAKLAEAVKRERFSAENIIAFDWNGDTDQFVNISSEIRNEIFEK